MTVKPRFRWRKVTERKGREGGPGVDTIERLGRRQSAPVALPTQHEAGALVNAKTREMMDGC